MLSTILPPLTGSDSLPRENANRTRSYAEMRAKIADDKIRAHTLSKYPPDITRLHSNGDIYIHDLSNGIIPYCSGADFEYLLNAGLWTPQIVSGPPKHFGSALCQLTNYFCISQNEWSGAQAVGDFNTLLAPFVHRDNLTPPQIEQELQRFVFDINQQSRSSFESPFTNVMLNTKTPAHLADKPVAFKGFDGFTYGDFSDESIEIIRALNRVYMEGDGEGKPLTFPIPSINLIPSMDFSSPMWFELMEAEARFGTYFFMNYIGTNIKPDTIRALCCLVGDTKIISRGYHGISYKSIREFKNSEDMEILLGGEFHPGTWFRTKTDRILYIKFANNQSVGMSPDHLCVTRRGVVKADELTDDDWMPFSLTGYEGDGGSYDLGKIIGLYIAEGSRVDTRCSFSLSPKETHIADFISSFAAKNFGATTTINYTTGGIGMAMVVIINSKTFSSLIGEFVGGKSAPTKYMRSKVFKLSGRFRRGVWDGWRIGDGSSQGRICTTSPSLRDDACALLSSLGTVGSITTDNRDKTDGKLGDNPLYLVRGYSLLHSRYKDVFEIDGERMWIKVKEITESVETTSVYDFDMDTEDELFQLANGLITHNCRLSLDLSELPPPSGRWTMGASTGSIGVVTINLGRLGFRSAHGENIYDILDELLFAARDSLLLKDTWIQSMYDSGMLPVTRHYGCNFDRYFRTIGVLGIPEMITNMTGDPVWLHMDIVHDVLTHIRNRTREFQQTTGKLFNLECVPGESAAVTLARKDRPLGIFTQGTSDNPYYSNLVIPSNEPMSISEKALLEEDILNLFTGGTVHRIFLTEGAPSPEALAKLIPRFARSYKIPYFDLCRTFSICPSDKTYYNGVITECDCGAKTNVYSRIVGYYRDIFNSNDGRLAEILDRAPSYI